MSRKVRHSQYLNFPRSKEPTPTIYTKNFINRLAIKKDKPIITNGKDDANKKRLFYKLRSHTRIIKILIVVFAHDEIPYFIFVWAGHTISMRSTILSYPFCFGYHTGAKKCHTQTPFKISNSSCIICNNTHLPSRTQTTATERGSAWETSTTTPYIYMGS